MAGQRLAGHSVLVTGGGTGIGAACALMAAHQGARVTICGRTGSNLLATAERIRAEGGAVLACPADITVEDEVVRLMSEASAFGGGLSGVVANAGGGSALAPYHLQDVDQFTGVLQLNIVGTMLCIKHAVPHLARAGHGSFVGMSSIAGHVTHPYFGAYPAAKAAIDAMIRNAADEYGTAKVRFNAIQPGFIATEAMNAIEPGSPVWESYVSQTPLGDVGRPEDIANVACFLLSDESRWITGQTIAVDGGNCLRRGPDFSTVVQRRFGADGLDPMNFGRRAGKSEREGLDDG